MNKKQKYIILIIAIIALIITFVMIRANRQKQTNTSFENNQATNEVVVEDIQFKNITKTYEDGITTIRADVYNNTKKVKNVNVKITLKDETGKEVKSMIQVIENIEPDKKKVLSTGVMGNYSDIKDIEFKIISYMELKQHN